VRTISISGEILPSIIFFATRFTCSNAFVRSVSNNAIANHDYQSLDLMLARIFSAMFGLPWLSCALPQDGHLSGTWLGKRTSPIVANSLLQPHERHTSLKAGVCIGISTLFFFHHYFCFILSTIWSRNTPFSLD
jgi:hypothetical protein